MCSLYNKRDTRQIEELQEYSTSSKYKKITWVIRKPTEGEINCINHGKI